MSDGGISIVDVFCRGPRGPYWIVAVWQLALGIKLNKGYSTAKRSVASQGRLHSQLEPGKTAESIQIQQNEELSPIYSLLSIHHRIIRGFHPAPQIKVQSATYVQHRDRDIHTRERRGDGSGVKASLSPRRDRGYPNEPHAKDLTVVKGGS